MIMKIVKLEAGLFRHISRGSLTAYLVVGYPNYNSYLNHMVIARDDVWGPWRRDKLRCPESKLIPTRSLLPVISCIAVELSDSS